MAGVLVAYFLVLSAYTQVEAQIPKMVISSNDLDGILLGESVSINCTMTIPEGYYINNGQSVVGLGVGVTWTKTEPIYRTIALNISVEMSEDARISVDYFNGTSSISNSSVDHTYQLTVGSIQESDFGIYSCSALAYYEGTYYAPFTEYTYLRVGVDLSEDKPTCYISPSEISYDDLFIQPSCTVKNKDLGRTVDWAILYPNSSTEQVASNAPYAYNGFNFTVFKYLGNNFAGLLLDKDKHQGVKLICSVNIPNGGSAMSCTTDAVNIVNGVEIIGANLLGANVGGTASMTARIQLPPGVTVTSNSWSKNINMSYEMIAENGMFLDDKVDLNRYDLQVLQANGIYTNTITISDIQDGDDGYYMNALSVQIPNSFTKISEEKFLRLTIGYGLSQTIPLCELRSEVPIPLEKKFRMDCSVEKSDHFVEMEWERITPTGNRLSLNYEFEHTSSEYEVNYFLTYINTEDPYSDYLGSTVVCTATDHDAPGTVNSCSLGPFEAPPLPALVASSNDRLEGISIGDSVSFNCTVTVPEGFMIGIQGFGPGLCCVEWRNEQTEEMLSINETALLYGPERLSAAYFNSTDSIDHTFELTIKNLQPSDTGTYMCRASIFTSTLAPAFNYVLDDSVHISVGMTTPMPTTQQASTNMPTTQTAILQTTILPSDESTTGNVPSTAKETDQVTMGKVPSTKPMTSLGKMPTKPTIPMTSNLMNTGNPDTGARGGSAIAGGIVGVLIIIIIIVLIVIFIFRKRFIQKNPTNTVSPPENAAPNDYGMGTVTSGGDGGGDGGGDDGAGE